MSAPERLDDKAFERLLEIHGGRAERWPEGSRESLRRLLESSAEARTRWEEAKRLDALLDALPSIEPAPTLMASIASLPARHPRRQGVAWWPFGRSLAPLLAWGAAAVLGLLVGLSDAPILDFSDGDASDGAGAIDVATIDNGSAGEDWADVSALATGADWDSEDE
jgi:ferric-dicitrate binding protein FerR (iron transport regulator)